MLKHEITLSLLLLLLTTLPARHVAAAEPVPNAQRIQPWGKNPFYWQYRGKPVLLVGGSDDDNLFQWPDDRLREQLDLLADCGGNYIRNTMSDRPDKGFEVYPFKRLADGRYNLEKWNDEYWRRFRRLLDWTAERDIIVQIEIWDRFDYTDQSGRGRWQRHPYNPANNVNYGYEQSGFARRYPDHPGRNKQPFFFTTPEQRNNEVVLRYQRQFVDRLLSIALPYGNVLYCIDNETSGEEAWGRYWAKFIRRRADKAGLKVAITEMWDDWNVTGGRHRRTYDHPEIYDFVDISQNNHNKHDQHWSNCQAVRDVLASKPRPINTVKTYGADGNKFGHSDDDGIERFWRHLLGGCASARFHRPDSGLGLNAKARSSIRAARRVESLAPFWSLRPAADRLSERDTNEAFAASRPEHAHVVYFPAGGEVELRLADGSWMLRWIEVESAKSADPRPIAVTNGSVKLVTPSKEHQIAVLTRAAASRPNVLFVLIDDMGWPDLACYGHRFHETPRIDRLASQGLRFTNFYATPVCSSTRATIESGQNSARVGITDFLPGHWKPFAKLVVPEMPDRLDHELTTPGEALGAAGYVTGYFGKWHLGSGRENAPLKHGYRVTAGQLGEAFRKSRAGRGEGPKRMDLITDQAIWFLKEAAKGDRPFFLHVSHHAVHIPIQAREDTIAKYVKKPKPDSGVNHPVYAAMVEDLDTQIGRLLDTLDELGLAENTVVIVASDNGGLREVYTETGQIVSTNAPLRSEKGTLYEGGIRVPFIVRWPGVTPKGSVCDVPAATWDLLPTFCAIAGIDPPDQPLDGVRLDALFRDPKRTLERKAIHFHYPHYHHSRPASAVREGEFKLIEWHESGALELYDLARDPGESTNLAPAMPARAKRMRENLAAWRDRVGARMPTANPKYDPERADVWWNRRGGRELDVKAFGDRLERSASKPYFRTK